MRTKGTGRRGRRRRMKDPDARELFLNVSRRDNHRQAGETGKRNEHAKQTRDATSGRSFDHLGNEMPGNWKSLNAPVCEDAYENRCFPSSFAKPLPFRPSPPCFFVFQRRISHLHYRDFKSCQFTFSTTESYISNLL